MAQWDGCERVMAYLLGGRYESPSMVICPLGFTFGGINKSYGGVAAATCASLTPEVSMSTITLGSIHACWGTGQTAFGNATDVLSGGFQGHPPCM